MPADEPPARDPAPVPAPTVESRDQPLQRAQKSYHTVLEQQIIQASEELDRPALALLLSGLTAGLDIGLGPFTMAVFLTLTRGIFPEPIQHLLAAGLYAVGFIFVVLGRSALYTEHTTSAIQPVFDGRNSFGQLIRLWLLVLVSNLVGTALVAWFAVRMGLGLHVADVAAFSALASRMTAPSSEIIFFSAIGAGWLMGLLSWLTVAARDTTSQFLIVLMTTFVIGLAGLHHSIAGSVEVLMAVFSHDGTTLHEYFRFLWWAVIGNAVGGVVMVSSLKFSHVKVQKA
jgi:formate/nitrite transporter FocA (FNT family)